MAEEKKTPAKPKYVDPNKFADYGAAMAPVAGDPMAVEWQKTAERQIAEATTPKALMEHLWDDACADRLLAKLQGAYATDPLTLTVIGAVSQFVMEFVVGRPGGCQKLCRTPGAQPCRRKIWNMACLRAFKRTKDAYIQTFLLDQLRWSGCKCRTNDIRALKANAANDQVKAYIDWVAAEVSGSMVPAK